jgi:hypothetical protein
MARSPSFAGSSTSVMPRCVSVFTVASPPMRAATTSPSFARADGETMTKSPSRIPRPIILLPVTRMKNVSSLGRKRRSTVM